MDIQTIDQQYQQLQTEAQQVGGQQLRVTGVLGAVEADKGRIGRQQSLGDSKLVHQLRHIAFAGSAVADDQ